MSMTGDCPLCGANLQGEPITAEYLDCYSGKTHYSRLIGHEVRGVYDGVLFWSCPDCHNAWPRWTDGGRLADVGARYVRDFNERSAAWLADGGAA